MAAREQAIAGDYESSMEPMGTFQPIEQQTDDNLIIQNPDGTITVLPLHEGGDLGPLTHENPEDWNENLAEHLDPQERMRIADELIELLEIDEQARSAHFRRMKDALVLMGLTDLPGSDTPFEGAATVTHPLIAEAATQFQARAIEEMFPAGGPVKATVIGKKTPEREAQAERVEEYMNFRLTEGDGDYFWHKDQMLFYLPLSGSAFMKAHIDPITGMAVSRFVKSEDLVVPYNAASLKSAPRYCHVYPMWLNDVRRAQLSGVYIEDARLTASPSPAHDMNHVEGRRQDLDDLADDRHPIQHSDDVVYQMGEYHIDMHMPWDDEEDIAPPYIIVFEKESREVLSVRRNWNAESVTKEKRLWFAHYKYLPGLGFYGFGVLHTLGSLAKAATGSMRAILDAAAFSNFQGGFKAKGASISGDVRLTPGVWEDVDASFEDLAKMFYTPPFKEPSPALGKMLEVMINEGRRFLTTTENQVGDASNRGPVGTTLALIEQGGKVFSAIHKRCHVAAREEYRMLAELTYEFQVEDEYPYEIEGADRSVMREDFDGRVDILPVSDPNIWSSTQRIAQAQAVVELIGSDPQLYGEDERREAHRRILRALRVPDVDVLLPDRSKRRLDPVSENQNFLYGKPARAFYDQDHDAHIAVHMNFLQRMAATADELVQMIQGPMQAHLAEHMAMKYRQEIEQELGMPLPPHDPHEGDAEELPPDVEAMLSVAVAQRMAPPPEPQQEEERPDEDPEDAKTIAALERQAAEHETKTALGQQAFEAEQLRKQQAFEAEERRRDEAVARERRRKQAMRQLGEGDGSKSTTGRGKGGKGVSRQ